jgi:hypothetical protein
MPESIIPLPTKEGATAYRRQYPIPHSLRPVLDKQIKEWLETGTIVKSKVNTSFNSPLLLVPKRNKAGEIINHRVCLGVRLLVERNLLTAVKGSFSFFGKANSFDFLLFFFLIIEPSLVTSAQLPPSRSSGASSSE